jgi:hypothetical protein
MRLICLALVFFAKYMHVLLDRPGESVCLDVVLDKCIASVCAESIKHTDTTCVQQDIQTYLTSTNRKQNFQSEDRI